MVAGAGFEPTTFGYEGVVSRDIQPCWALCEGVGWRFWRGLPHIGVAVPLAGERFWVRVWVREWVNSRSAKIAPLNKEKGKNTE